MSDIKRIVRIPIDDRTTALSLPIGRQGENNALRIIFDCSYWQDLYPDGGASLLIIRAGDGEEYLGNIIQEGSNVIWDITSADTGYAGVSSCQLRWHVGDVKAKWRIFNVIIDDSLCPTSAPTEVTQHWIDTLSEVAANVEITINQFKDDVEEITLEFNENASEKTESFNNNVIVKTNQFDTYYNDKITQFDAHVNEKIIFVDEDIEATLEDVIQAFNDNAQEKTDSFNDNFDEKLEYFDDNASDKQIAFNDNATSKTTTFNTNATTKQNAFDENYESKMEGFDDNALSKTTDFNDNSVQKTQDFNINASSKQQAFEGRASQLTDAFNTNASDKTEEFNNNANTKIGALEDIQSEVESDKEHIDEVKADVDNTKTEITSLKQGVEATVEAFDTNAQSKTNAFNNNAVDKTQEYNSNATQKTEVYNTNHTNKLKAYNDNATAKTNEFNSNASTKTAIVNGLATQAENAKNDAETAKTQTEALKSEVEEIRDYADEHYGDLDTELESVKEDLSHHSTQIEELDSEQKLLKNMAEDNLYSYEEVESEVYSVDVPKGAKLASVQKIGGKSIVWNQLVDKSGLTPTLSQNGVTFTKNADGSITGSGNATATCYQRLYNNRLNTVANHKYYARFTDIPYTQVVFYDDSTVRQFQNVTTATIFTSNGVAINLFVRVSTGNTSSFKIIPQVFDLTQIFGEGNEPTLDQCKQIFVKTYYPSAGAQILNAEVENVVIGETIKPISDIIHKYFPTGMKSAGSVHDYIDFKNGKAVRNVGKYLLRDLNTHIYDETTNAFKFQSTYRKYGKYNVICERYPTYTLKPSTGSNMAKGGELYDIDNYLFVNVGSSTFYIRDTSLNKDISSILDVNVYFELADPIITDINPTDLAILRNLEVEEGGSITFEQNDIHLPIANSIEYLVKNQVAKMSDIANFVRDTDYASSSKGGAVKISDVVALGILANGTPVAQVRTKPQYDSASNNMFVGKGTLENVLAQYQPKEKQYELIEEITVAEDTPYPLSKTSEPNGTPYNFDAVFIYMRVPDGVTKPQQITIYTQNANTYLTWEFVYMNTAVMHEVKNNKGLIDVKICSGVYNQTSNIYRRLAVFNGFAFLPITKIGFTDQFIPVGTVIKIFGIRR